MLTLCPRLRAAASTIATVAGPLYMWHYVYGLVLPCIRAFQKGRQVHVHVHVNIAYAVLG